MYYTRGFLDEWDYWAGTFGLVILALVETILFVWVMGPDNMWKEIHEGASIRIPTLLQVRHDVRHAGLPAHHDDLVDGAGGGADAADEEHPGRPAHGALGVARPDAGHPALPALAHQGGLAPPGPRRQGGGLMNTTALIFMAGAWIFVLGPHALVVPETHVHRAGREAAAARLDSVTTRLAARWFRPT